MHKVQLLCVITVALIAILLQCKCQAALPRGSNVQLDALKNQFLPAEYKNRNFTVGT